MFVCNHFVIYSQLHHRDFHLSQMLSDFAGKFCKLFVFYLVNKANCNYNISNFEFKFLKYITK